jgi:hypothetical protein
MKNGNYWLIGILAFAAGIIICYFTCQYSFLNIDTSINVVEFIFSLIGLAIGIYIALVFERKKNKNQNFYTYVEKKFDTLWEEFINLNEILDYSNNVELNLISKSFKSIQQKLSPLKKIFEASDYNNKCINNIELKIDSLDTFLTESKHTNQNIIQLDEIREELTLKLNHINETFAESYKEINNI